MKLKSIRIQNYKSFGNENNTLILENINTIIGKNESGKSNLIDCLSKIDLTGISDQNFFDNFNKNTGEYPNIKVVLEPYKEEKDKYNIKGETTLIINNNYVIDIFGSLSDTIKNNNKFQENRDKMNELNQGVVNIFIDQTQRGYFKKIIEMINSAENKVFINYKYIKTITDKICNNGDCEDFSTYFKNCISYLNDLKTLFPIFIEVNDLSLKSKYTKRYLEDEKESKVMLNHLLNCIGFTLYDLMKYWNLSSQADKENYEEDFNNELSNLMNSFNAFYSQERVKMKASFENDSINFVIKTTKKYMNFEERSNGLKWYLNMYIQILSKTKKSDIKNYIILIDEPGVYLHINAQKEILKLFENLSEKNNLVIYTTHSPFMIYEDKLYRTKLVIKDSDGNSNIGNKYYSLPHKMGTKLETITPLLTAIGSNINYNVLASNKLNIITEGISDYNYLKGYYILKGSDIPNIIPSSSVDNIHNIVSIFIGWGCSFKIVLDQDSSGRKQYNLLLKKSLTNSSNISFVDGTNLPNQKLNLSIENVFSENDKNLIGIYNDDYKEEKAYYSLEILKKIENKEFKYDDETISNFEKIVNQLFD